MRPLADTPATADRDLGVLAVTGPDRLSYLHAVLSQHVEAAPPGTAADFLHLDAKGLVLTAGRAVFGPDTVWLLVPTPTAPDEAARLDRFRFMSQVEVADRSAQWAVVSVRGPRPAEVRGAPTGPMTAAVDGDGLLVRDRGGGVDLAGPRSWVAGRVEELGLPAASRADWEAWRVAAGEPAWGAELAQGRRAQELGLLPTHVHLRKGCYPGQESIAKIHNLGRPRRALAVLAVDGDEAAPGDPVVRDTGRPGEVTSAARGRALALVGLDRDGGLAPGATLTVASRPATVVSVVGAGLAHPGASAAAAAGPAQPHLSAPHAVSRTAPCQQIVAVL